MASVERRRGYREATFAIENADAVRDVVSVSRLAQGGPDKSRECKQAVKKNVIARRQEADHLAFGKDRSVGDCRLLVQVAASAELAICHHGSKTNQQCPTK